MTRVTTVLAVAAVLLAALALMYAVLLIRFERWKRRYTREVRRDAALRSQAVATGLMSEQLVPWLPGFEWNARDARFLGAPVDLVVFDGLSEGAVRNVIFVEVKTGSAGLSPRERLVRDAVSQGRVQWREIRLSGAQPEPEARRGPRAQTMTLRSLAFAFIALSALGCVEQPAEPEPDPLLARYVAFGNSITAGFQSNGINDSTQGQSYAALVAAQMNAPYAAALLARPGCPPPLTNLFTGATLGAPTAPPCASLAAPQPITLTNVAVPGARIVDIFANYAPGGGTNQLTPFLLGGSTQLQAARFTRPTVATIWIGNNEVLGAALAGNAAAATSAELFAQRYQAMVDSVGTLMSLQGALLIGVVNVSLVPALSPGVAYFAAKQQGALPATYTVAANCAPAGLGGVGETTLVPFTYGFANLYSRAAAGEPVTLDCVADSPVLTGAEIATVAGLVTAYNQTIAAAAAAQEWAYFDPNPVLDSLRATGEIPLFPNAPPHPLSVTEPFGKWFSLDGVHPSALTHRLIANRVIDAINARYGTSVPRVP